MNVVEVLTLTYVVLCNSASLTQKTTTLPSTVDPKYKLYHVDQWIITHAKKYLEECKQELSHVVSGRSGKSQEWEDLHTGLTTQYFYYIQCNWACYMKKFVATKEYPEEYRQAMECNAKYLEATKDLCAAGYDMRSECSPMFGKDE